MFCVVNSISNPTRFNIIDLKGRVTPWSHKAADLRHDVATPERNTIPTPIRLGSYTDRSLPVLRNEARNIAQCSLDDRKEPADELTEGVLKF